LFAYHGFRDVQCLGCGGEAAMLHHSIKGFKVMNGGHLVNF